MKENNTLPIILGSTSKYRRAEIESWKLGTSIDYYAPDIDEKAIRDPIVEKMVIKIAHGKADAILEQLKEKEDTKEYLIITADQVIRFGKEVREKPESKEEAKSFYRSYGESSDPAECVSGVVITNSKTNKRVEGNDITKLFFDVVPDDIIDKVIEKGDCMWCCGAITVENPLLKPYIKIDGDLSSVFGLPRVCTTKLLNQSLKDHQKLGQFEVIRS